MANSARNQPGAERSSSKQKEVNPLDNLMVIYENNKKRISTATTVIIVVAAAWLAYSYLYKKPAEEKASAAMYYPELYYSVDSIGLAMNGDGRNLGFVKIAKKYDGTAAGNIAHYYSGVCYMKTGDFRNAITELKKFNGKGTMVGNMAYGLMGEAYMEMGDKSQAIENFKKATSDKNDGLVTPMFLYQLGVAYEASGNNAEAVSAYKRIRDEYPRSMQARDMDKELARLGDVN